jgi:hypothetical protein
MRIIEAEVVQMTGQRECTSWTFMLLSLCHLTSDLKKEGSNMIEAARRMDSANSKQHYRKWPSNGIHHQSQIRQGKTQQPTLQMKGHLKQ